LKSLALAIFFILGTTILGCASAPFDIDAHDFRLNRLVLGIAFPPLQGESDVAATVARCRELGIRRIRYQESWTNREPERDVFDWKPMDARIDGLHRAGIRVLLTLGGQEWPTWLGSDGGHREAATLAQFREYVSALLRRYAGKIDRIQFGNEWNWEIDAYMGGDESAYIEYANILYEETMALPAAARPTVVLGSLNGLAFVAFDQGLIGSIVIEQREPYQKQIARYRANPDRALTRRAERILGRAQYEMLDIHLYDDYGNWPAYLRAIRNLEQKIKGTNHPILVSEFGGPFPRDLTAVYGGRPAPSVLAGSLINYLRTLDAMELTEAYFFSLAEDPDRYHRDSYLIDSKGRKMPAYEVLRRFGDQNRGLPAPGNY